MIKNRISEIDALRGIACLMVVFNHFGNFTELSHFGLNIGCIGVDLFFIISGFVISLTIENNPGWKYFLINRFSRLFPTYWICLIFSTIIIAVSYKYVNENPPDAYFFKTFATNLTMLQFYIGFPNIDGSYWTLIIELLFYFFILVFLLFKKKYLIEIVGAIFLLFPLAMVVFQDQITANEKLSYLVNRIPLLAYFSLFFSGILFYKIKFEQKNIARWILLLFCFTLQLFLFDKFYSNKPEFTFLKYVTALSILYLAFILYINNKLGFIVNKPSIWCGSISYCLYLVHQSVGMRVILPFLHDYLLINFWVAFILTFILLLLISHLILKYVERPGISYFRSKYLPKPNAAAN